MWKKSTAWPRGLCAVPCTSQSGRSPWGLGTSTPSVGWGHHCCQLTEVSTSECAPSAKRTTRENIMDRPMCSKAAWERRLKHITYDFVPCTEGRAHLPVCPALKGAHICTARSLLWVLAERCGVWCLAWRLSRQGTSLNARSAPGELCILGQSLNLAMPQLSHL